jgi:hypothetical protein
VVGPQKANDRWLELCERAAAERDSEKHRSLVHEINWLLHEKQERLDSEQSVGGESQRLQG